MIDDLEKKLSNLPKRKLGLAADLKIKLAIYFFLAKKKIAAGTGFSRGFKTPVYKFAAAAMIFLAVAGAAGASHYVYQDSRIAPGHRLYQVKQTLESAQEKLTFTPAAKIKFYDKLSEKRLEEALYLSESQAAASLNDKKELEKNIDQTISRALENLDLAASLTIKLPDKQKPQLAQRIDKPDGDAKLQALDMIEKNARKEDNQKAAEKAQAAKEEVIKFKKIIEEKVKKNSDKPKAEDGIKNRVRNGGDKGEEGWENFEEEKKNENDNKKENKNLFIKDLVPGKKFIQGDEDEVDD